MLRRTLLIGAAAGVVLLGPGIVPFGRGAGAQAQEGSSGVTEFDRVLGDPDAPVTIFEYASFTCPHCASFHTDTLPELKSRFIDTGRAKLVFRQFPLNQVDLRAGLLLRCVAEEQYFNMAGVIFQQQRQWASASDPVAALGQIGRMAGLNQETIDACMADEAMANRIIGVAQTGQQQYGVNSTPTFVIGEEVIVGARPIEEFARAIEDAG